MNYLEIFNEAWSFAGFQNRLDSVSGLKGEPMRLHYFINQEYQVLQGHRDWTFKHRADTRGVLQTDSQILGTGVQYWKGLFYNDQPLTFYDTQAWLTTTIPAGQPSAFTIDPLTQNIQLNALDANYNIEVLYKEANERLTSNSQVPKWPTDFHQLLVFAGAAVFGSYLGDTSIEERALVLHDELLGQMYRLFVPGLTMKSKKPFFV